MFWFLWLHFRCHASTNLEFQTNVLAEELVLWTFANSDTLWKKQEGTQKVLNQNQTQKNVIYSWFSCDVMSPQKPLNSRYHFFDSRNGYSSVMLVKLPIFGFLVISSCNSKVSIFQKFITEFCMGRRCWMVWCHLTWPPHTKLSSILEILKFWITATSPKLWLNTKNWQRD